MAKTKIDVFGSCVVRDIFRFGNAEQYQLCSVVARQSVPSLFAEPIKENTNRIDWSGINNYEKRQLLINMRKTGLDLLEISDLSCNGPSGTTCIRACNLSPDLGPFDVALENRGNSYRTFTNVRFQEVTPFSSFAAGWYSIYVFRTNAFNNSNAIAAASASLKAGKSYTLYMFNDPSNTGGLRTLILSN